MRKIFLALTLFAAACGGSEDRLSSSQPAIALTGRAAEVARDAVTPAKQYFARYSAPSVGGTASFGSYAKGCLAGAQPLAETGPTWQAMRLSRNRNWGAPQLVSFVQRLSAQQAQQPGWEGIYVGDMSQPRGGPMASGHASHQIGLDADIWLTPPKRLNLSVAEREALGATDYSRVKGTQVTSGWTPQHSALVKAAAKDPAVARIFIFPGAKIEMCRTAGADRDWLRKVRPWWGHTAHMHVRLSCPAGMSGCSDQDAPPAGDGCAEAETWVKNILNPPPPDPNAPKPQPSRPLTLADLPAQCAMLVAE